MKMSEQDAIEYAQSRAKDAARTAYSAGWSAGFESAKEDYGKIRGRVTIRRASEEDRKKWDDDTLAGWCECHKPISSTWAGFVNFCPWCGRIIDWKNSEIGSDKDDE